MRAVSFDPNFLSSFKIRARNYVVPTLLLAAMSLLAGCGSGSNSTTTTTTTTTQPNYPFVPPVPITWTPETSPLPAPPAQQLNADGSVSSTNIPPPAGSNDFPLTVSSPTSGATATSPLTVTASATPTNPIFFMRVYVDQLAVYFAFTNSINAQIFVTPGPHTIEVMAEDNQGYVSATLIPVTITTQAQTTITGIQNLPGWISCTARFAAGSGRDGQICADGLGNAVSTMTEGISSPSMDGKSAEFTMSGPTPYSNELYWNPVAGGNNVSHFSYDLYFYIDNPDAAQALEFDLNQTYGGQRWVWGSECNFRDTGKWDIWDDVNGWMPTSVDCTAFPANTWVHLVWNVERVGNQVHYINLTVGDQTYNIDTYYSNQPNWTLEEIDNAFQMDLDYNAGPYNVWLDQVNLTAN